MTSDQEQLLAEDEHQELAAILHQAEEELFVMMEKMGETLTALPKNIAFLSKAMDIANGVPLDMQSYHILDRAVRVNSRLLIMQVLVLQTVQLTGWKGLKDWADEINAHRITHMMGLASGAVCEAYHEESDKFAKDIGFESTSNLKTALLISNMIDDEVIVAILNAAITMEEGLNDGN